MTKAKKKKKVIIAQIPKAEAPTDIEDRVGALRSLVATPGWAVIVQILNDNISYLEKAILEKIDPETKTPLSDDEVERLRYKRSLNIELKDTPKKYTKMLIENEKTPTNYDPYWNIDDVRKMESSLKTK